MAWLVPVFTALQAIVLSLVISRVTDDYMDEVFHGPQAREYCRGAFTSWHPKITTFPGIYYLATLYGWSRRAVQALVSPVTSDVACATPFLRSLNVLLSIACLVTLHAILTTHSSQPSSGSNPPSRSAKPKQQRQDRPPPHPPSQPPQLPACPGPPGAGCPAPASLHSLLLALYPLHWFFSFLFYTDVAALLFLLLAHLQATRRHYRTAALAAAAAVLCRQTNAVWAAFVLGEAALAELGLLRRPVGNNCSRPTETHPQGGRLESSVSSGSARGAGEKAEDLEAAAADGLVSELGLALDRAWRRRGALAAALWPLLLPPAGFVAFLMANGGSVVLGDKEAHRPVRHGAQLLYFAAWTATMLAPQLLPAAGGLVRAVRRRPLTAAVTAVAAVGTAAAVAHVSTMVHPYMLADNRHYVFYLWRRLLDRHALARYALAPVYAAAWALLLAGLRRRVSRLWVLGFAVCLAAQLLPAWLLELRYFTPGFYFIALRLEPPTRLQAAVMLAMYGAINAVTMYLFLYRPYTFADGSVARFIW